MNFLNTLERQDKRFIIVIGFVLIGVIGILDYLTGYELAFSLFYVLPIALITWLTSRRIGLAASLTSALVWLWADLANREYLASPFVPLWNTIIRLLFFVIITLLLSIVKRGIARERELARLDNLTGAVNSQFFYELTRMEMNRLQRYDRPFTLAYIDIDNFKAVNDQSGHLVGDQLLRLVVSTARARLRKTDVIARLGGDEFALLFPETDQESARGALANIGAVLAAEMQQGNWPVTFSIGVLTCLAAPPTPDDLVRMADELMYSVKRESKNAIKYAAYEG